MNNNSEKETETRRTELVAAPEAEVEGITSDESDNCNPSVVSYELGILGDGRKRSIDGLKIVN